MFGLSVGSSICASCSSRIFVHHVCLPLLSFMFVHHACLPLLSFMFVFHLCTPCVLFIFAFHFCLTFVSMLTFHFRLSYLPFMCDFSFSPPCYLPCLPFHPSFQLTVPTRQLSWVPALIRTGDLSIWCLIHYRLCQSDNHKNRWKSCSFCLLKSSCTSLY